MSLPQYVTEALGEPDISIVVIGRNEGDRLVRCLQSIRNASWQTLRGALVYEIIYVDSHSTDDSCARAAEAGARVLGLGNKRPTAAAGRNTGWRAARAPLVMFLDGDTILHRDFVPRALEHMSDRQTAAVWGHRREIRPEQSVYTRVLDLDWIFPPGTVDYFGGDVLVKRAALAEVDGFDDLQVAGEEPELCRRLRERGWLINHIDIPMTGHDLAICSWQGYWRRAERAGLAYAQVAARFAQTPDPLWLAESRRNVVHGSALLATPGVLLAAASWQPAAAAIFVMMCLSLLVRSAWRCRWKARGHFGLAMLYAVHSHVQQVPILVGQYRYWRLAARAEAPSIVEYKAAPAPGPKGPRP